MTNVTIPKVNMFKTCSIVAVSFPIILSIKFGFISVNGPWRRTFVDALRTNPMFRSLMKTEEYFNVTYPDDGLYS